MYMHAYTVYMYTCGCSIIHLLSSLNCHYSIIHSSLNPRKQRRQQHAPPTRKPRRQHMQPHHSKTSPSTTCTAQPSKTRRQQHAAAHPSGSFSEARVSRSQRLRLSWVLRVLRVSGSQGLMGSGPQGLRVSGIQRLRLLSGSQPPVRSPQSALQNHRSPPSEVAGPFYKITGHPRQVAPAGCVRWRHSA